MPETFCHLVIYATIFPAMLPFLCKNFIHYMPMKSYNSNESVPKVVMHNTYSTFIIHVQNKLLMNTYRHATYNLVAHYHFRIAQFDMTISRVLSVVLILS